MSETPVLPEPTPAPKLNLWNRMRQTWWSRALIDISTAFLIFFGVSTYQGWDLIGSGEEAPDFALQTMDGTQMTLSEHRGKPVLLAFWAPWCSVCTVETGNISGIKASMGEDVHVISVVVGYEDKAQVRAFMDEHEVDYPVMLGTRALAKDYAVSKFPTLYVLDEEGRIDHAEIGYTTELGLRWRLMF
jgi:peroxiredoxin